MLALLWLLAVTSIVVIAVPKSESPDVTSRQSAPTPILSEVVSDEHMPWNTGLPRTYYNRHSSTEALDDENHAPGSRLSAPTQVTPPGKLSSHTSPTTRTPGDRKRPIAVREPMREKRSDDDSGGQVVALSPRSLSQDSGSMPSLARFPSAQPTVARASNPTPARKKGKIQSAPHNEPPTHKAGSVPQYPEHTGPTHARTPERPTSVGRIITKREPGPRRSSQSKGGQSPTSVTGDLAHLIQMFVPEEEETPQWTHEEYPKSRKRYSEDGSGPLFVRDNNPNILGILDGHAEPIRSIHYSRNGQIMQSISEDGEIWTWSPATGDALRKLVPEQGASAIAADLHSDSGVMATFNCATAPCKLRLRDMKSPSRVMRLSNRLSSVSNMRIDPKGRIVVATSHQGDGGIYDLATGEWINALPAHRGGTWSADIDPSGKYVATAGQDHRVRLWDRKSQKTARQLRRHKAPVHVVRFSPSGKEIVSGTAAGEVQLWNVRTGRIQRKLDADIGAIHALTFSRSGHYIAAGGDRGIQIWDRQTGRETAVFSWSHAVSALTFSPDGGTLASGDVEGVVVLWEVHIDAQTDNIKPVSGEREASYRRSSIACLSFSACSAGLKPVSM